MPNYTLEIYNHTRTPIIALVTLDNNPNVSPIKKKVYQILEQQNIEYKKIYANIIKENTDTTTMTSLHNYEGNCHCICDINTKTIYAFIYKDLRKFCKEMLKDGHTISTAKGKDEKIQTMTEFKRVYDDLEENNIDKRFIFGNKKGDVLITKLKENIN